MKASELQRLFSANLKAARNRANLSQMKLAEKSDLSVGYICDLENERRWGTPETFSRLANALGIEPFVLLLPPSTDNTLSESERAIGEKVKQLYFNNLGDELKENVAEAISKTLSHATSSAS